MILSANNLIGQQALLQMMRERIKSRRAPHYVPAAGKVRMSWALRQGCWVELAKTQQFCLLKNFRVVEIYARCQHTQDWAFLIVIMEKNMMNLLASEISLL